MAIREETVFWGVWGGFPPIIGRTWSPSAERGGLGGILPPILGRTWHPLRREGGFGRDPPPPILGRTGPPAPMTVAADNLGPKVELTQAFLTLRVPFGAHPGFSLSFLYLNTLSLKISQ